MGHLRPTRRAEEVSLVGLSQLVYPDIYSIADPQPLSPDGSDPVVTRSFSQEVLQLGPALLRDRDDERARLLAEKGDIRPSFALTFRHALELAFCVLDAQTAGERHLCHGDDLAPSRDIVGRVYEPGKDHLPHEVGDLRFGSEVRRRRSPGDPAMNYLQVLRAGERDPRPTPDHHDYIPLALEGVCGATAHVLEAADHPDPGGGVDRPRLRLVVEADVAANDRGAERLARLG